jgi:hypothetical protein
MNIQIFIVSLLLIISNTTSTSTKRQRTTTKTIITTTSTTTRITARAILATSKIGKYKNYKFVMVNYL